MIGKYGFGKQVNTSFDQAIERVTQELQKEGFGVLTDIDVAATLKKKLNQEMPPYRISAPATRRSRTARLGQTRPVRDRPATAAYLRPAAPDAGVLGRGPEPH